MSPSIAIITRLSYDKPFTPNQRERFSEFVNSLKFQCYTDFKVYLLMYGVRAYNSCEQNRRTVQEFVGDDPRFIVADPERNTFDIEVRLDYDDQVSEVFVQDIVNHYERVGLDNFILSYQPTIIDTNTGDEYRHPSRYSSVCPSMCMALIQKKEKRFGVYDRPHNFMAKETGYEVYVRPEGLYWLQVHGNNTLSKLPPKSMRIHESNR